MKNLLFITDFSPASSKVIKRIYPVAKALSMKLKVVHYSSAESTEVMGNQSLIKEKITWFMERSLGFRPRNDINGMGIKGSLRKVITETGRFFDLIVLSDSIDKKLIRKHLFEEENFTPPCPILLLSEAEKPFELKKALYIGAQFNELDWGIRRQLRNICRRSNAELQVAKPLPEKDRWFYSKTPFNDSKFLTELGWFRGLFFDKLKSHIKKEEIDVVVLSPQSLTASWLSKRMFVWKMERLNVPILILPSTLIRQRKPVEELEAA